MMGAFVGKGLTLRTGQTHVQKYLEPLMRKIEEGQIDPSFLITHKIKLEDGPDMYKTFQEKTDGSVKIVINPSRERPAARRPEAPVETSGPLCHFIAGRPVPSLN